MRFEFVAVAVVSALVGGGVAVGIMSWEPWDDNGTQDATSTPTKITATEAEARSLERIHEDAEADPTSDAAKLISQDFLPFCEANERVNDGWRVECSMEHFEGATIEQWAHFFVSDKGEVTDFP